MRRKVIACCASLGAGICMLVGMGVGRGIGTATAFAVEGVARQPEAFDLISETLATSIGSIQRFLVAAFVVAMILLMISRIICIFSCGEKRSLSYILGSVGAGIAIFSLSGTALGIGEAAGAAVEGIARQPEAADLINEIMSMCNSASIWTLIAVIAVVIGILICTFCKCGSRLLCCDKKTAKTTSK